MPLPPAISTVDRIYVRDSQRRLTDVRKKTREPTWNESFVFAIAAPQYQELVSGRGGFKL